MTKNNFITIFLYRVHTTSFTIPKRKRLRKLMAKLVVTNLNVLSGLKGTSYFRIFGQIIDYDIRNGTIMLKSLFDNTTCEIELNIDTVKTADKLQNGLVVDVYVVRRLDDDILSTILSELNFDIVMYPKILMENKEILQQISELQDFRSASTD